jgi:hypothetical protein
VSRRASLVAAIVLLLPAVTFGQGNARRLTTIEAIRQFPGYYHLQNVLVHGEFVDDPQRPRLRSETADMRVVFDNTQSKSGPVEARGVAIDVGRLEPGDPRVGSYNDTHNADTWPKPGEELLLRVTSVADAEPAVQPSVRALALEPWKFEGQTVTVSGNFRGRNLFGDTADAPGSGKYDFVLRSAEAALWVTGLRPRGKGFDLDVDRRLDTDKWLEVTGVVRRKRGLVSIEATKLALTQAPQVRTVDEEAPPLPPPPLEVVFSAPTAGETDVSPAAPVRIQFSRGLKEPTIAGRIRASYVGAAPDAPPLAFKTTYDAATRSISLEFATPLEPLRTVKVELLDGLLAFDGGPLAPWTLTFSVGTR